VTSVGKGGTLTKHHKVKTIIGGGVTSREAGKSMEKREIEDMGVSRKERVRDFQRIRGVKHTHKDLSSTARNKKVWLLKQTF